MEEPKRYLWCETTEKILLGRFYRKPLENPVWWQKLLNIRFEPGTFFEFAHVTFPEAVNVLDEFFAFPKYMAIETKEGNKIEFHFENNAFVMDCWFDDEQGYEKIDGTTLDAVGLEELIAYIFEDVTEKEIIQKILEIQNVD